MAANRSMVVLAAVDVQALPGDRAGHGRGEEYHRVGDLIGLRQPVAKQATSTAVLTGNRLVLGVGTSPWREDYQVLGVDRRGQRMDEAIAIVRGLAPSCAASPAT
jgi:hypothetical protein